MYRARIETDKGRTFVFGPENCNVFDIDPLSGVDVNLSTSQGFQQIGETVENQSVKGISRTIKGTIYKDQINTARQMLTYLSIFTTGRLYYNDEYYCEIIISKTPYVKTLKDGKVTFSMMVFCSLPYWYSTSTSTTTIGAYEPRFKFPVIYDSHMFGEKNPSAFINCYNAGAIESPYEARFTCTTQVKNPGLVNVYTLEKIEFNMTLELDDELVVRRDNGVLAVELTRDGKTTNALAYMTEDSTLFWLNPGDNVLRLTATEHVDDLICYVSFNAAEVGVI